MSRWVNVYQHASGQQVVGGLYPSREAAVRGAEYLAAYARVVYRIRIRPKEAS